ncbi:hypothetical protein HanIR_Chr09g0443991 [Helianthus annuus]|nr:hypothetical protein HanIR_Chr09g0443991 [Helianthus annuus]
MCILNGGNSSNSLWACSSLLVDNLRSTHQFPLVRMSSVPSGTESVSKIPKSGYPYRYRI